MNEPNNPKQNKPDLVNTKKVEPCDKCSSFTHTLMDSNGGRFCGKCKKPKKAMPPPTEVEVVENLQTVLGELSEPPESWELEFDEEFLTCDEGKCCSKHQFNPRLAGRLPTVLKAFIRKVHDQAYEQGFNDCSKIHYEP